jgi:nicotinamidase-related amidase
MPVVRDTSPYPWPYDGHLVPARLALVIAGADEQWLGRSRGAAPVAERLIRLSEAVRGSGGLVVHVHHDRPPRAPESDAMHTPMPNPVPVDPADLVVSAAGIDGFYASALDHRLRAAGRDQLAIGGFGLEATVHSTLRSANDAGYECLLLTDGAAPLDPVLASPAASMVTMSGGIFGALGLTVDLLAALAAAQAEMAAAQAEMAAAQAEVDEITEDLPRPTSSTPRRSP